MTEPRRPASPSAGSLSLRAYAKRRGVSDMAVRKAIKSGRLHASVGHDADGRPLIVDPDLADQEWTATSRTGTATDAPPVRTVTGSQGSHSAAPPTERQAPTPGSQGASDTASGDPDEAGVTMGQIISASSLIEAQKFSTIERARKLKLENDQAEGRLLPVDKVAKEAFEAERTIREAILNIPARIAGELAAETDAGRVYMKLDAALRDALNATADALLATVNE